MNQDVQHRLTPLAILAVFLLVIPGLFIGNLFAFSYRWFMHVSMIERLASPGGLLDIVFLTVLPQLAAGIIASFIAMRLAFAIKFLRQANYEIVAYSVAGIGLALDAFPLWVGLNTEGYGFRIVSNVSNLAGVIIGLFLAFRSIRAGVRPTALLGGVATGALTACWVLGALAYAVVSIRAAYLGFDHHLGNGWAIGIIILSLIFRFTPALTVGAFLGAMNVWHWHWAFAALFAAPGLAFMIPGVIASILSAMPWRRRAA